ncbi:MAG: hypothetical protein HY824_02095 [Acidobacteria bacterium]|nr:hypothetical protein [Acidobacteriota bacterium]
MVHAAMAWLADTRWSIALHESQYAYAIVESIHVWALCLFVGFAVLLDLRLVGAIFRDVPVSQMVRRLLPWTKVGFVVMVVSGVVLYYAIPLRTYHNVFFRLKAVLLILAGLNVFLFHRGIYLSVARWDLDPPPRPAKVAGLCSLVLWAAIVVSGRMIAYNWFDCAKPQSAGISLMAGCTPDMIDPYSQ